MQLRLGGRARTTKDMDLLLRAEPQLAHQALVRAALLDLNDWFQFEVAKQMRGAGLRFPVQARLDGRAFEAFHIDVGSGDPLIEPADNLMLPALLEFADIRSPVVPCYPLTQQIAEKVHAYTRPYATGEASRVKDWVDLLLIAELGALNGSTLRRAMQATFDARGTHPLPTRLPVPPSSWSTPFRRIAREVNLGYPTLADAVSAISRFIDPVLEQQPSRTWDPLTWTWH